MLEATPCPQGLGAVLGAGTEEGRGREEESGGWEERGAWKAQESQLDRVGWHGKKREPCEGCRPPGSSERSLTGTRVEILSAMTLTLSVAHFLICKLGDGVLRSPQGRARVRADGELGLASALSSGRGCVVSTYADRGGPLGDLVPISHGTGPPCG